MFSYEELVTGYKQSRIDSADIVLFHQNCSWKHPWESFTPWAIQASTKSPWNHTGLLYVKEGEFFVIEALTSGVAITHLKDYCDNPKYDVCVATYKSLDTDISLLPPERLFILDEALQQVGEPYDFSAIVGIQFNIWFKRMLQNNRLADKDDNTHICSRLVARSYKKATGIRLVINETVWNLTPGGLGRTPLTNYALGNFAEWEDGRIVA